MIETLLAPVTTEELTTLVEDALPCEYAAVDGGRCYNQAQWILFIRNHDCMDEEVTLHRLFCDDCLSRVKAGDEWRCHTCQEVTRIIAFIVRIEPI